MEEDVGAVVEVGGGVGMDGDGASIVDMVGVVELTIGMGGGGVIRDEEAGGVSVLAVVISTG